MKDDLVLGKAVKKLQRQMQAMKALAPQISMPGNKLVISSTLNPAKWTYERLAKYIQEFESSLDDNHEIGARLVSFGTKIVFHIENIGYHGPDIITFYGIDDSGQNVQLIQNISQLSVLLVAVKKTGKEPRRIGFSLLRDEPEEESETVAVGTPVTRRPPRTDPGVRISRTGLLRDTRLRNQEYIPDFAIPCSEVCIVVPILHVRPMFPLQATYLC